MENRFEFTELLLQMINKRKICVISSSRADYNHLFLLMKSLKVSKNIDFKLVVTGMHLLKKYGLTYKEIISDGFKIDAKIDNILTECSVNNILSSMSDQLKNSGKILDKISPDIVVLLGDRYDILPIAISCHLKGIPIAHFHGGEVTHGAIDDGIRHSITKLSDLHFVSNQDFKRRVKQLGESTKNIYNIGSLGVLAISSTKKINKNKLLKKFNISGKYILVALHPETINNNNLAMIQSLSKVLSSLKNHTILFTSPNSDPGNKDITNFINTFIKAHPERSIFIKSAGREIFINLIRYSNFIIGNSSSCVIEAPALKTPSVLIGNRQGGRPISSSVFNCKYSSLSIKKAINKINDSVNYKINNSYRGVNSLPKILKILSTKPLHEIKLKKFNDL